MMGAWVSTLPGIKAATQSEPFLDFVLPDGIHQKLWRITDEETIASLRAEFAQVHAGPISPDGHSPRQPRRRVMRPAVMPKGGRGAVDFIGGLLPGRAA